MIHNKFNWARWITWLKIPAMKTSFSDGFWDVESSFESKQPIGFPHEVLKKEIWVIILPNYFHSLKNH